MFSRTTFKSAAIAVAMTATMIATMTATGAAPAEARTCRTPEQTALDLKMVQTELMVSALACGNRAAYNAFVTAYKPTLAQSGKTLKALFAEAYAGKGGKQLNSHVTRLANEASSRHISRAARFCERTAALAEALVAEPERMATLIAGHPYAGTANAGVCDAPATLEARAE